MKRLICLIFALVMAAAAMAQSPEEIISRMEAAVEGKADNGLYMIVDVKMPIVGSISTKTWTRDGKVRTEAEMLGVSVTSWTDGKSVWTYNSKNNEVEITDANGEEADGSEADMLTGITEGYDVTISNETDKTWTLGCKKAKWNKNKDDPKSMTLVVSKKNYHPVSLSTKIEGVSFTMRNFSFNVSEDKVTFNAKDYPDVKIVDKRGTK